MIKIRRTRPHRRCILIKIFSISSMTLLMLVGNALGVDQVICFNYSPYPNGYQFPNFDGHALSPNDFYNVYGIHLNPDTNLKLKFFYDHFFTASGGNCFGMSASSLVLYSHGINASDYSKSDLMPNNWKGFIPFHNVSNIQTVQDWIQYCQTLQYGEACLFDFSRSQGTKNVYKTLKSRLELADTTPQVLAIGGWGENISNELIFEQHGVVPYEIEENSIWTNWEHNESINNRIPIGTGIIYVYDPNYPQNSTSDSGSKLTVYLSNWTVFAPDIPSKSQVLIGLFSLDAITSPPKIPSNLAELGIGDSHLLYTDSSGRKLGFDKGVFKNEIQRTSPIVYSDQENINSSLPEAYYVPDPSIKMELYGVNNSVSNVSMMTPKGLIVAKVPVSLNSVDEFKVLNNGTGIYFNSENSNTPSIGLLLDVETSDHAQIVNASISQIEAGGSVNLSNDNGTITIKNNGLPRTCNMSIEQAINGQNSNVTINNIVIKADSTVHIEPSNWNDISNTTVTIDDVGSNGSIYYTETIRPNNFSDVIKECKDKLNW